ncbi:hypothetical protein CDL12_27389 [Handroanthus impetiginosus]|uniref:Uncharacterized protein n=1 Tax=Handroanthus impetiginosus TaxID=429701 RepID=A0A2G9G487_9LAMI|nr:hypothetical protein CDL12_27389 [Handroanthus impetiginosus]
MSTSLSSIATTSTIFKHRHPPPIATPCARFFRIPFAAKTHLLSLSSANFRHASPSKFKAQFCLNLSSLLLCLFSLRTFDLMVNRPLLEFFFYHIPINHWKQDPLLLYVTPAPGRMGYLAAAERFLKVMAMVWAGSQVTKLIRAGGALALAPFVDRGLSWFTVKLGFESQGKAFMAIAGLCFGLAFLMFVIVTLLWA